MPTLKKSDFDDLVAKKLARVSADPDRGLFTYKYDRRVDFDFLWNKDPNLIECRGVVFDIDGNCVARPPMKSFYLEQAVRISQHKIYPTEMFIFAPKVNGFMATLSMYQGKKLVSTTGTTNSDFARMASRHLVEYDVIAGVSQLYEICDPADFHVVPEFYGAHHLVTRDIDTGEMFFGDQWQTASLRDIEAMADECRTEGFMAYTLRNGPQQAMGIKFKSPYYLALKKLQRMNPGHVENMYTDPHKIKSTGAVISQMVDYILSAYSKQEWTEMTEVVRNLHLRMNFK